MDNLNLSIRKLRFNSFFLFWLPIIALLGSLFIHNFFVEFKFRPDYYKFYDSNVKKILCNEKNNYCHNLDLLIKKFDRTELGLCEKDITSVYIIYNSKILEWRDGQAIPNRFELKKNYKYVLSNSYLENKFCIKNAKYYNLYKLFPGTFDWLYKLKKNKKYTSGTKHAVYPFLFGETSISNIAKRYPIYYIFKPFLIMSSIFMVIYWYRYNKIYNHLSLNNKINDFLIFGCLSGFFLFLHVLFLGSDYQSEIFQSIRRIVIISFILCEVLAQFFLIKKIYPIKKNILNYINELFLNLKILLVGFILLSTATIITILIFYDLPHYFDYFLEWNYFLILLFFYLLTFFMWKKKN